MSLAISPVLHCAYYGVRPCLGIGTAGKQHRLLIGAVVQRYGDLLPVSPHVRFVAVIAMCQQIAAALDTKHIDGVKLDPIPKEFSIVVHALRRQRRTRLQCIEPFDGMDRQYASLGHGSPT